MFLELFVMGEMQVQRSKSCLFKHHLAPTTCTAERLEIIKHILVFQTCIALYKELFVNKWLVFVNMWKHMKCICCVLPCAFIQVPWPIKLMQDLLCFSFPLPSLFLSVGAEWRPPVCLDIPHSLMQLRVRLCEECALECLCYDGRSPFHSTRPQSERPVKWVQGPELIVPESLSQMWRDSNFRAAGF